MKRGETLGISAGVGVVVGTFTYLFWGAITPSETEQLSSIESCAEQLTNVATESPELPNGCFSFGFDYDIQTTKEHRGGDFVMSETIYTYYLPSQQEFLTAEIPQVPSDQETKSINRKISLTYGSLGFLATAGLSRLSKRKDTVGRN